MTTHYTDTDLALLDELSLRLREWVQEFQPTSAAHPIYPPIRPLQVDGTTWINLPPIPPPFDCFRLSGNQLRGIVGWAAREDSRT